MNKSKYLFYRRVQRLTLGVIVIAVGSLKVITLVLRLAKQMGF